MIAKIAMTTERIVMTIGKIAMTTGKITTLMRTKGRKRRGSPNMRTLMTLMMDEEMMGKDKKKMYCLFFLYLFLFSRSSVFRPVYCYAFA